MKLTKKSDPKPGKAAKPATPFVPTLPTVNLLPPEIVEVLAVRSLRRRFVVAGIATMSVIAVLFCGQFALIAKANADLDAENAKTVSLTSQMRALAPVKAFYASIAANQKTIMATMANEVLYSDVVDRLNGLTPSGVQIGNVSLNAAAAAAAAPAGAPAASPTATACPGPDPFNPGTSVGCVNLTGTASSRQAVGRLIQNLFNDDKFANPYVSSTTVDGEGKVTFTATVGLTDKVYSKRYADVNFLKEAAK